MPEMRITESLKKEISKEPEIAKLELPMAVAARILIKEAIANRKASRKKRA